MRGVVWWVSAGAGVLVAGGVSLALVVRSRGGDDGAAAPARGASASSRTLLVTPGRVPASVGRSRVSAGRVETRVAPLRERVNAAPPSRPADPFSSVTAAPSAVTIRPQRPMVSSTAPPALAAPPLPAARAPVLPPAPSLAAPRASALPASAGPLIAAGAFGIRRQEEESPDERPVLIITNELPRHTLGITLTGPKTYHRGIAPRGTITVRLEPGTYEVRASGTTVARSAGERIEAPYGTWPDTFEGYRRYRIWLSSRPLVPTRPAPAPAEAPAAEESTPDEPELVKPVPEEP